MYLSKKNVHRTIMIGLATVIMLGLFGTPWSYAYTGEKYASQAKINLQAAENIALKVVPGKIKDEELEKENGGSGLRYSFDILYMGKVHEVGVDAISGKVLENSLPGPNAD